MPCRYGTCRGVSCFAHNVRLMRMTMTEAMMTMFWPVDQHSLDMSPFAPTEKRGSGVVGEHKLIVG